METFTKLFERFLVFVYHCFDRMVIQGYLPLLVREAHIVHFFRYVRGEYPITGKVLQRRTDAYRAWVDSYARNHQIPVEKAKKDVSTELRPGAAPCQLMSETKVGHSQVLCFQHGEFLFPERHREHSGRKLCTN
jgi:hypothetical protein